LNLTLSNDISEISRIRDTVAQFCRDEGLAPELEDDLCLALEEIVINVIRYAYPDNGQHEISLRLNLENTCVSMSVEDDGVEFNPLNAPEPDLTSPIHERRVGGLGILLVRKLMDSVEYQRAGGRNHLTMKKNASKV
jgi:serine/threonine-protein kinase RsbW/sigma-B regulation protein RsbU (phosphoserine phosphatase)